MAVVFDCSSLCSATPFRSYSQSRLIGSAVSSHRILQRVCAAPQLAEKEDTALTHVSKISGRNLAATQKRN